MSSSSSDVASSSSSSDVASSSDEDSSSSEFSDSKYTQDHSGGNQQIKSLDDLPSDDSVSIDSDDDEEGDNYDDDSDGQSGDDSGENQGREDDTPLGERIQKTSQFGVNSLSSSRKRAKELAKKKASERIKEYKQSKLSNKNAPSDKDNANPTDQTTKKKSKHAPAEVSSKKGEFYKRGGWYRSVGNSGLATEELITKKYRPRDPRMTSLSGHLNNDTFEKNYSFLEEIQLKEIKTLKSRIASRKLTGRKGRKARKQSDLTETSVGADNTRLIELKQLTSQRQRERQMRESKQKVNKEIRDRVASGQQGPYYLKKRDMKRKVLELKYDDLKESGQLQKVMAKKRKKNLGRDGRRL